VSLTVKITVNDGGLEAKFKNAPETLMPFLKVEAEKMNLEIIGDAGKYPPSTDANRPGRIDKDGHPMGFYVRSQGWYYPVKGKPGKGMKKGIVGGSMVAFKLGTASQQLKEHWTHAVKDISNGVLATIGNAVTYFDYVNGDKQTDLFAKRGWKKLDLDNYHKLIIQTVRDAVNAWKDKM